MTFIRLCGVGEIDCARTSSFIILVALFVLFLALDLHDQHSLHKTTRLKRLIDNLARVSKRFIYYVRMPKQACLALAAGSIDSNGITLQVYNLERFYHFDFEFIMVKFLFNEERIFVGGFDSDGQLPVGRYDKLLKWLPELNSVQKKIGRRSGGGVEFIRVDSEAKKFYINYGYWNNNKVTRSEFGPGRYNFGLIVTGQTLDRRRDPINREYMVRVRYDGQNNISIGELKAI